MGLPSDVCAPKCSNWHCVSLEHGVIGAAQSINCHQLNPATPSAVDVQGGGGGGGVDGGGGGGGGVSVTVVRVSRGR